MQRYAMPSKRLRSLTDGKGVDYVMDCAGTEETVNQAILMCSRGGKICLAAFPHGRVGIDLGHAVMNNIYLYGIRGKEERGRAGNCTDGGKSASTQP